MTFRLTLASCCTLILASLAAPAQANEPYCREYTRDIRVGSRVQEGYGTACLQPDGAWQIVSQNGQRVPEPIYVDDRYFDNADFYRYRPEPVYYEEYYQPAPRTVISFGYNSYSERNRHRWYNDRNKRHHDRYSHHRH